MDLGMEIQQRWLRCGGSTGFIRAPRVVSPDNPVFRKPLSETWFHGWEVCFPGTSDLWPGGETAEPRQRKRRCNKLAVSVEYRIIIIIIKKCCLLFTQLESKMSPESVSLNQDSGLNRDNLAESSPDSVSQTQRYHGNSSCAASMLQTRLTAVFFGSLAHAPKKCFWIIKNVHKLEYIDLC